jgi:opacity protein-like surface antigen
MKRFSIVLTLILFVGVSAFAQRVDRTGLHQSGPATGFKGVSLSAGYYSPSMDYYSRIGQEFDGSFTGELNAEYWISRDFIGSRVSVRVGVGYFATTAKTDYAPFPEETTISLIPINLDLLSYFSVDSNQEKYSKNLVYVGFGGHMNTITNDYKSPLSSQSSSGKFVSYHLIGGYEYKLTDVLFIGPEVQYTLGSFSQSFLTSQDVLFTEDVRMNGLKFLVRISYQIDLKGD